MIYHESKTCVMQEKVKSLLINKESIREVTEKTACNSIRIFLEKIKSNLIKYYLLVKLL